MPAKKRGTFLVLRDYVGRLRFTRDAKLASAKLGRKRSPRRERERDPTTVLHESRALYLIAIHSTAGFRVPHEAFEHSLTLKRKRALPPPPPRLILCTWRVTREIDPPLTSFQ